MGALIRQPIAREAAGVPTGPPRSMVLAKRGSRYAALVGSIVPGRSGQGPLLAPPKSHEQPLSGYADYQEDPQACPRAHGPLSNSHSRLLMPSSPNNSPLHPPGGGRLLSLLMRSPESHQQELAATPPYRAPIPGSLRATTSANQAPARITRRIEAPTARQRAPLSVAARSVVPQEKDRLVWLRQDGRTG